MIEYRIEWWNSDGFQFGKEYRTKKMFEKYLYIACNDGSWFNTSVHIKAYQVVNMDWKKLKHKDGIII